MDYKCECGWELNGKDENYVVTCLCGKPMKPLIAKKAPGSKVPCGDGLDGLRVNLNQTCRIKVLIRGVDAYNKYFADLGMKPFKDLRPNDTYEGPLHEIMNIFGEACYMGPEPPFETEIEILSFKP
jgi:hypothetical protein